ncbi:MAG: ribonuclease H family protein [Bacteroidales bacterium]|nr:ribonuclease H family protein [Bacteroidales bacterium]
MANKKERPKYYVVWSGLAPGIYNTWEECRKQVEKVNGARYKSYPTLAEAEAAFRDAPPAPGVAAHPVSAKPSYLTCDGPKPILNAIATDAACSGNPGAMEYRGVHVATGTQLFHYQSAIGTNNIGEFLGLVHALSYLKKHNLNLPIYTDSVNAMKWVREKKCRSKLPLNDKTAELWDFVRRAEAWLHNNDITATILKWDTDRWGEIPADFGRK